MSAKIQSRIAKSSEDALAAFVSRKAEIDTMLTRLQALSDDHATGDARRVAAPISAHPAPQRQAPPGLGVVGGRMVLSTRTEIIP